MKRVEHAESAMSRGHILDENDERSPICFNEEELCSN